MSTEPGFNPNKRVVVPPPEKTQKISTAEIRRLQDKNGTGSDDSSVEVDPVYDAEAAAAQSAAVLKRRVAQEKAHVGAVERARAQAQAAAREEVSGKGQGYVVEEADVTPGTSHKITGETPSERAAKKSLFGRIKKLFS